MKIDTSYKPITINFLSDSWAPFIYSSSALKESISSAASSYHSVQKKTSKIKFGQSFVQRSFTEINIYFFGRTEHRRAYDAARRPMTRIATHSPTVGGGAEPRGSSEKRGRLVSNFRRNTRVTRAWGLRPQASTREGVTHQAREDAKKGHMMWAIQASSLRAGTPSQNKTNPDFRVKRLTVRLI